MSNEYLLIKGRYILTMDDSLGVIENGAFMSSNGTISAIYNEDEIPEAGSGIEILDAGNSIVMPGMVNTHTHAAMSNFRGLADDKPLDEWLNKHIWPAEARFVDPEFVHSGAELAVLEMIKSGITFFNDMYFFEGELADVAENSGIRVMIGEAILDFPTPSSKTPEESIEKTLMLFEHFRDNPLVKVSFAPHSVYVVRKDILSMVSKVSEANNIPIHIHISETEKEVADCIAANKSTPVEYLGKIGFLSDKVIAAHSIHLSDDDLKIYREYKVNISHNPISNMKLASGIAPISKMLKMGLKVSLGTDGAASNNTLDLFSEMRMCSLLHKISNMDPTAVSAKDLVRMATLGGAEAMGAANETGSISIGKKTDIITINLDKPHLSPMYDPFSHLVNCANSGDVENVIINGRIIMKAKKVLTMDEEGIISRSKAYK